MTVSLVASRERSAVPALVASQRAAVERAVQADGHVVIVGPPGSGKTTVVAATAALASELGVAPERMLVLSPTRESAARLRDGVAASVGRASGVAVVHTAASVAHAVLSAQAEALEEPPPRLITGADQDAMLRDLLEGHRRGAGSAPDWTGVVPPEATALPAFRAELRDLIMRATEAGLSPDGLRDLAALTGRVEWDRAAAVYDEYLQVARWPDTEGRGLRYDPASAAREAAVALDGWRRGWGPRPSWDLVVVDDYQDVTAATIELLDALATGGARLVLVGNADESVQGYRGAVPSALAQATASTGRRAFDAELVRLDDNLRQSPGLAHAVDHVVSRIGTQSVGSARRPSGEMPAGGAADIEIHVAPHRYAQSRAIAAALRRARHGVDGPAIPWDRMGVVARSNGQLRELRADLLASEIPCETLGDGLALHEQSAIAPLLAMMLIAASETEWSEESATQVLGSRLIGMDPVALRRLRRQLVREDRAGGGAAQAGELLVDALADPTRWASLRGPEARAASRASAAVQAARAVCDAGHGSPRRVIWALWEALGVAESWRSAALAGSARDDADLDAVIALMREAQNVEERRSGVSVAGFVDHLASQEFAVDSLGARAHAGAAVAFATPASAAGREWDLVVIAGVEEGLWPNLRLRDSVLGAQHLAELLTFRATAEPLGPEARSRLAASSRRAVLDDETRSFAVALSRATRRAIITCVEDEDSRPSRFVDWIRAATGVEPVATGTVPRVSDLRHAVAALRARGAIEGEGREGCAVALARLAALGVPGADPGSWSGVAEPSTEAGFFDGDGLVRVSPSKVDGVERCGLRWALESAGGVGADSDKQQLGTLIHELAHDHPAGSEQELVAALGERWHEIAGDSTLPDRALRTKAEAMVRRLAEYFASNPAHAVALERRFDVEIGQALLTGSADRVETRGASTRIVDLKTGDPSYAGDPLTHAQLAMYQLAAEHGAFPGVDHADGAALVFVGGTTRAPSVKEQPPIDVAAERARLANVVEVMRGTRFAAVENDMCGRCPVRRACPIQPEGRQVSDA
ncbi:UrvD/REP family ATP-dependent DNA helicase [Demequina sp. NBRC 110053]|uniref:UrvD/REP family ATP-dependent DNA helicase n=1 Tax=Demequina sp. NBRC 110053 TaxID=1570342 RepID=UPI000A036F03|nr:UrvD/REP family ATP-dependent DNA helicase [Demequina sp. NBRC 110053]